MVKTKWSKKMTNEEVLECIGRKRMFINNILHRKVNNMITLKDRWRFRESERSRKKKNAIP